MKPIFVNSFPKSGTHYVTQFFNPIATPCQRFIRHIPQPPWFKIKRLATHENGGWGPGLRPAKDVIDDLAMMQDGEYAGGHLAHVPEVVEWVREQQWAVVFLYRDLRDVAVSATYHAENYGLLAHPGHEEYMQLPTHEKRLRAVIAGHERWEGLRARWEQWAPWLQEDWVLRLRFRDALHNRGETAGRIVRYLRERGHGDWSEKIGEIATAPTSRSRTKRKGVVGEHGIELTPELVELAEREFGEINRELGFQLREVEYA